MTEGARRRAILSALQLFAELPNLGRPLLGRAGA